MMSYDKYERGRQHLNGGHQRITYKREKEKIENKNKNKNKNNTYPTAYLKSSMGRGRPCHLNSFGEFSPNVFFFLFFSFFFFSFSKSAMNKMEQI